MRSIKKVLLKTLAIAFFSGLTLGGAANVQAEGMSTGAGGHGHPGVTEDSKGSGGGGSTGSDYNSSPDYYNSYPNNPDYYRTNPDYYRSGSDYYQSGSDQSGSGAATGGSTDTSSEVTTHDRGSTINGVFWPDYSSSVGSGGNNYWEK